MGLYNEVMLKKGEASPRLEPGRASFPLGRNHIAWGHDCFTPTPSLPVQSGRTSQTPSSSGEGPLWSMW